MIVKGQAGISCGACGHEEIVTSARLRGELEGNLTWANGDPVCPSCGITLTFEDYLGDDDPASEDVQILPGGGAFPIIAVSQ